MVITAPGAADWAGTELWAFSGQEKACPPRIVNLQGNDK
jgi:hypothetical protein